jgi:hypothetical protein
MRRETWWDAFWHDSRRLNTYMMVVTVVALSFKAHRVYCRHDPDPWMLHPRYFARWFSRPRPAYPARPVPHLRRRVLPDMELPLASRDWPESDESQINRKG